MTTKKELQEKVAELQAKVDAMEDDVRKGNDFLFYPEVGDSVFGVLQSNVGPAGYAVWRDARCERGVDYPFPKYKDLKRAERVAWGRGQMDIWKAMGEDYKEGLEQWFVFGDGDISRPYYQEQKTVWGDALFRTPEAAQQALKDFGGIDKLNEARLAAQWGI